jgi:hypothetical protein
MIMPNVAKIIEKHGGMEWLKDNYIRLENPPWMRLVIEYIGEGPRGLPAISVAHYYEQNGDQMRDPEIVFEVGEDWEPVSYQQDGLNIYQEAVYVSGGKVVTNPRLIADLKGFARLWDRNIAAQGFLAR